MSKLASKFLMMLRIVYIAVYVDNDNELVDNVLKNLKVYDPLKTHA